MKLKILFISISVCSLIFVSELTASNWTAPAKFPCEGKKTSCFDLCMNNQGSILMAWKEGDRLLTVFYDPVENRFGHPIEISQGKIQDIQIILNDQKNALIIWIDSLDCSIRSSIFDQASKAWSSPHLISKSKYAISSPKFILRQDDKIFGVWQSRNGINSTIQSAVFDINSKKWSSAIDISAVGIDAEKPSLSLNSKGKIIAIWNTENKIDHSSQVQVAETESQKWSPPITLSPEWKNCLFSDQQITSDSKGHFVASWTRSLSGKSDIQMAFYHSILGKWSLPIDFSNDGTNYSPDLKACGDKLFIVWEKTDGPKSNIYFSQYQSGYRWSDPEKLFVSEAKPVLSFLPNQHGDAQLVWTTGQMLYAMHYRSTWENKTVISQQETIDHLKAKNDSYGNVFTIWKHQEQYYYSYGHHLAPPSGFTAVRRNKRFPAKTVTYVDLQWVASKSPRIKGYKLYRNGQLITVLDPNANHLYDYKCPSGNVSYKITAIHESGLESWPVEVLM